MARGQRGGRPAQGRRSGKGSTLPGRRGKKRKGGRAPQDELPTAAPGAAETPVGSSIFGGTVAAPRAPGVQRPQQRSRGGPRQGPERRSSRRLPLVHDFRYVGSDLRWIGMTTVASGALVLILWVALRL